jgi:hypothetical protein
MSPAANKLIELLAAEIAEELASEQEYPARPVNGRHEQREPSAPDATTCAAT